MHWSIYDLMHIKKPRNIPGLFSHKETSLLLFHERITIIFRRNECFFRCSWRDPAQQVDHTAGFVVCSGSAAAAEGLLPDNCTFLVDLMERWIDFKLRRLIFNVRSLKFNVSSFYFDVRISIFNVHMSNFNVSSFDFNVRRVCFNVESVIFNVRRPNETDRRVRTMVYSGVLSLTGVVSSSDKIPVDILNYLV